MGFIPVPGVLFAGYERRVWSGTGQGFGLDITPITILQSSNNNYNYQNLE